MWLLVSSRRERLRFECGASVCRCYGCQRWLASQAVNLEPKKTWPRSRSFLYKAAVVLHVKLQGSTCLAEVDGQAHKQKGGSETPASLFSNSCF